MIQALQLNIPILQALKSSAQLSLGVTSSDEWDLTFEISSSTAGNPTILTLPVSTSFITAYGITKAIIRDASNVIEFQNLEVDILSVSGNDVTLDFDSTLLADATNGVISFVSSYWEFGISEIEIQNRLTFLQRIKSDEMQLLARRKLWVAGTTYRSLFETSLRNDFYAVSNGYVYINITNKFNPSLIAPSQTVLNEVEVNAVDGYSWMNVGKIDEFLDSRFGDTAKFPVTSFEEPNSFGRVLGCQVYNTGSNFKFTDQPVIVGDGVGATARISRFNTQKGAWVIEITNPGRDYTWANIKIPSTSGTGFISTVFLDPGNIGTNLQTIIEGTTLGFRVETDPQRSQFGDINSFVLYHSLFTEDQEDLRGTLRFVENHEFQQDDWIIGQISGTITKVLDSTSTREVKYQRMIGPGFIVGESISTNAFTTSIESVVNPSKPPIGEIVLHENRATPIVHALDQVNVYKFRLELT